ncbi:DNA cytosine methyltransferase [Gammaproteobacteria bacterium]|nr:DNA cytosine methyltransferase [Gammaproteobacteria bacterium]
MIEVKSKHTFIDLFAGCGGLSLGIEKAGFFPLYVNELNKDALETYLINREQKYPHLRDPRFHSQDIKECINPKFFKDLKENIKSEFGSDDVDLICGGPPCQGFSGIGIRRSYSVAKEQLPSNHLYQDMSYFIHKMQPKMFLFENVEGLLSSKWTKEGVRGEIFKDILKTFIGLKGYIIKYKLVHAKDYGVPQNRPRILIVGIKSNVFKEKSQEIDAVKAGFLPEVIGSYPHLEEVLSDIIDKNFEYGGETKSYPSEPKTYWQKQIRTTPKGEILAKGQVMTEHEYSNHTPRTQAKFQAMINNKGVIPLEFRTKKFAQRVLPKKWGNKGPSITITSLADDFVHYKQARAPTVRECARIQTFPDWYKFSGKRTTGGVRRAGNPREKNFDRDVPKFTQIGNAVPVELARNIGTHFKKILNNL